MGQPTESKYLPKQAQALVSRKLGRGGSVRSGRLPDRRPCGNIAFFIVAPIIGNTTTFLWVDYSIAVILAADIAARMLASTDIPRQLKQLTFWVDIFILLTLLFPPLC